jgi:hypothetical protein
MLDLQKYLTMSTISKRQQKHEAHMLTYALGRDGKLINVDHVPSGQACGCVCPACKEPLVAKNKGQVRIHHFAHQSGADCNLAYETMLHLLAKEKIQNAFLSSNSFKLSFQYRSYCPKERQCHYVRYDQCYTDKRKEFDLRRYYECCEQEVAYDNIRRRSDLKLFSSTHPEREPVYIEFCVTHASEQTKLHSGNRIIECVIESEEDIDAICESGFVEEEPLLEINDWAPIKLSKVQLYGFKNCDYENNNQSRDIEFSRYVLYRSGKTRCYQDGCKCKELRKSSPYSLYEAAFHTPVAFGIYEYAKYLGWDKYHIPNCMLCKNYVDSYSGMGKLCRLYKILQIPRDEVFDTARAKSCPNFEFNQKERDQLMKGGCNASYEELL